MTAIQKAALPLGSLLLLIGVLLVLINQNIVDLCRDFSSFHPAENCAEARAYHSAGLICAVLGIIFVGVGMYLAVEEMIEPERSRFRCPYCRFNITYRSSPLNCVNCGMRLDWSREDAPDW